MKTLTQWAEKNGLLLHDSTFEKTWRQQGGHGGSENDVYFDEKRRRWHKRNNLSHHGNFLEFFQRLQLHNYRFPESTIRFENFVEHEGQLLPVISQMHDEGERGATREEVRALMARLGFTPVLDPARKDDYVNQATGEEFNDIHDENAVIDKDGSVSIFDPSPRMLWESKLARVRESLRK